MYDPKADGHCGWRAASVVLNGTEQEWPLVKVCMDAILKKHSEFYRYGLRVEYDDLLRMLSHQTEGVGVFSNNYFETLDCPRLLAEAYNRPVVIYSDDSQMTYLPHLQEPPPSPQSPIVLYLSAFHFRAIVLDEEAITKIQWPPIYPGYYQFNKDLNLPLGWYDLYAPVCRT
ncbi:hypothetical protein BJV82DRAFT_526403 [Fennellomyces sp. T-0311]|nr:hypothetical protein BJV82DRAFT_526403 [Fennellomyces sp. T-0311]